MYLRAVLYTARTTLALIAVALVVGAAPAGASVLTVQRAQLTATSEFQTWESKTLKEGSPVYAYMFYRGHELRQEAASACGAYYLGYGIVVRLHVAPCGVSGPGTYRLRYASTGAPKKLTVKLFRTRAANK